MNAIHRRNFIKSLGLSAASLPFLMGLPSLGLAAPARPRQRLVVMFSPNGTIPSEYWPDEIGSDFKFKEILSPLEAFKDRTLMLKGLSNKVRGDGDGHMRGMSCLLTAIELNPGNIQGGSDRPAGWAKGISIDQEIKNYLQSRKETATRFGSLELGVNVGNRADPWTRWTYAGNNQPVAPSNSPYEIFDKLYGQVKDRENLGSEMDEVGEDLSVVSSHLGKDEREMLEKHTTFVRQMEKDLAAMDAQTLRFPAPKLEPGVDLDNDGIPKVSGMQADLLVNAFANDLARVATLEFTNSVGQTRMRWLGINDGHHGLSHEPDSNKDAQEKLVKINIWFAEQLAALATKLDSIPEPGGSGTMLDNTTIVWTNELGKGNSHSHEDIPFVLLGGGLGFQSGRSLQFEKVPHNRLWLSLTHAFGRQIQTFGNQELSQGGPLSLT